MRFTVWSALTSVVACTVVPDLDSFDIDLALHEEIGDFEVPYEMSSEGHSDTENLSPISEKIFESKTARAIVLEEMIRGTHVTSEAIVERIRSELPAFQWVTIHEITDMRKSIGQLLVQPIWFHNILMNYDGGMRDLNDPEFMAYLNANIPESFSFNKNPDLLWKALYTWIVYCVAPLEIWNRWLVKENIAYLPMVPCMQRTIRRRDNTLSTAMVITRPMIVEYLQEELSYELGTTP
jgi:hypothetical protein